MKTSNDLFKVADAIANIIESGIEVQVAGVKPIHITAIHPDGGLRLDLVFEPGHKRNVTISRLPAELFGSNLKPDDHPSGLAPELPVAPGIDPEPTIGKKRVAVPTLEELDGKTPKSKWFVRYNIEKNLARITIADFLAQDSLLMRVQSTTFAERMSDIFGYRLSTARKHVSQAVKMGILKRWHHDGQYWIELMLVKPEDTIHKAIDETVLP